MNKELEGVFEEYNGLSEEEVLNLREKYVSNDESRRRRIRFKTNELSTSYDDLCKQKTFL